MLTPGEAVVPKYLVPLIAPFLAAHKVPGFGGIPGTGGAHFALGGLMPLPGGGTDHIGGSGGGFGPLMVLPAKQFIITLTGEIAKQVHNSAEAKKIANALMTKISQEIAYAKSTSAAMKSGLNLGGMDVTQGSVADQMQSYVTSLKAFSKDISALHKGGLSKDLLKQIIAAGPIQGDALAQSILTGGGTSGSGIKDVNKLYGQIGHLSNVIGAQAAGAVFGGTVAPNLKSGTFVSNNVSISVSAPGSGGLGGMTDKQVNQLVAMIQKKLLQQAQRNRKTNLKLKTRGI